MLIRVKYMHYAIHESRIISFVSFQCQERFLPPSNSPWVVALWAVAFFVWRNAAIAANQRHEGTLLTCAVVMVIHPDTTRVTRGRCEGILQIKSILYIVCYTDSVTTYLQDYSDSARVPWSLYSPQNGHRKYAEERKCILFIKLILSIWPRFVTKWLVPCSRPLGTTSLANST